MLFSYFKTAFRFLVKNRTFSIINMAGLALGTLCCLYILLYVAEQYSYDKHQAHASDIYRITTSLKLSGDASELARTSPPIAPGLKHDFAEVEQYTRVFHAGIFGAEQHLLKYKEVSFYEPEALFVDSTFFSIFTYHFIKGNPATALTQPFTIVLLKPSADKLFGKEDPIGKVIQIDNKGGTEQLTVTGVVDESLGRSHIQANAFITMHSGLIGRIVQNNTSWASSNYLYSYVKLKPGTNADAFASKLNPFLQQYGQQQLKELGMEKQLHLQPIHAIHTSTDYQSELSKTVGTSFLYILILIAGLIQLIACINFMNLSTARAFKRAKEVGVRKVMGAGKNNLVRQFLGESFLLTLGSIGLAVPLLLILLPFLNQVTGADIQMSFFRDYRLWLALLLLTVCTGLLAGSYPAFYLAAFQAIKVIKGNFTNQLSAAGLRRSLVVFQFVLSIVLMIGMVVIYSQLNYIKNKDLGFSKDQKLIFGIYAGKVDFPALLDDFRQLPEVRSVTRTNSQLGKPIISDMGVYTAGGNAATAQDAQIMVSDKYFIQTTGIKMVSGRDFRDFDSGKVLINETLARSLRINPQQAEGTKLYQSDGEKVRTYEVAGIMKDFHYNSLHETVKPFMLIYNPNSPALCDITVNCNSSNYKNLLGRMEVIWRKNAPETPFIYSFLDDLVQNQYETEIVLSRIINSFTGMAILISCLGLFGLAAFSAEQRSKEIGIRKVLGASVTGIIGLLNKEFLKLVGIALVIAIPIAWWAMDKWLAGFAYRFHLQWWLLLLASLPAILVALFTVSFQAIKAAIANPVKSLRSE